MIAVHARRWLRRTGGALLLVLLVLVAWLMTIHFRDQRLSPAVAAILADRGGETIKPADNLFFTALGMLANGGEDLNAEGKRVFAAYEQNRANIGDITAQADIFAAARTGKLPFAGDPQQLGCFMWREENAHHCIVDVAQHRVVWTQLVASNQRMLERYRRLWTYTQYQDPTLLSAVRPIGPLTDQTNARRLFFMSLALKIDRGELDEALREIGSDMAFWRHLLATRNIDLIDKMIFTVRVRSDLEFISEILRTQKLSATQFESLATVLTPVGDDERAFTGVWENEIRVINARIPSWLPKSYSDIWRDNTASDDILDRTLWYLLYRPNAQANSDYRLYHHLAELDRLPCSGIGAGADAMRKSYSFSILEFLGNPLRYFYGNPWDIDFLDYPIRLCDLQGMQRVVGLQWRIRRAGLIDSDIPAFIAAAGADFADPFTGQPMRWDPKNRTLWFDPRDKAMGGILPWPI